MRFSTRSLLSAAALVPLLAACGSSAPSATDAGDAAAPAGAPITTVAAAPAATVAAVPVTTVAVEASPTPAGATDTTAAAAPAPAPVVVPESLNFSAPLVGGGEFAGADVAGLPVAFWFWAPT